MEFCETPHRNGGVGSQDVLAVTQQCTTMLPHMIYLLLGWITVIRYYLKSLQLIQKTDRD